MKLTYTILAVILSLFVLLAVNLSVSAEETFVTAITNRMVFSEISNLALFAMLGLLLVFANKPLAKRWAEVKWSRVVNWGMMAATVLVFGYIFVQSDEKFSSLWVEGSLLGDRAGDEKQIDFVVAGIGLILILDGTRRAIGWTLPVLCFVFAAYAMFGREMPAVFFPHAGNTWQQIVQKTFLQDGVFGIALSVMFKYVFLFVLFGALLEQTGATGYVINFARRIFRNSTGGPAKIAVLSSGLMGSLSGSAVANTAATGTFTIPLMKSSGFKSDTAGGVEAAASAGGALMPPIMGAGAYMMLEMVQPAVTYLQIIKAALVPALLYYFALLMTVHFHSKRIHAAAEQSNGEKKESAASGKSDGLVGDRPGSGDDEDSVEAITRNRSVYQGFVFFSAFVVLIAALLYGLTPFTAVSISLAWILLVSVVSADTRLNGSKLLAACVGAARGGMALIVAASCVGIILGVVDLTPLSSQLPLQIQSYAGDNALVALLMLMCSTIVLGMGLPSAVCYLLMASLVGKVLISLNTPPLAAHLFVFYFGMMSMVTPPVALAAYAAAAISKGNVMRTAFEAFRFSLVGFALPFAFVLKPELIMLTVDGQPASWIAILVAIAIAVVAVVGLSAAVAGFFSQKISWSWRVVLMVASLLVFLTRSSGVQWTVQLIAVGLIAVVLVIQFVDTRRQD